MPEVTDQDVTAREAVRQFDAFCDANRWLFTEVPGGRDKGKDGYVDVSARNGDDRHRLTGEMFAVQVKGGTSWRSGTGYRIPVDHHGGFWRHSSVPVIGIVWDPADDLMRWANLTAYLVDDPEANNVPLEGTATLDQATQIDALLVSVRGTPVGQSITYGFGSLDVRDQQDSIWDCFAIGRRDARALIALRRVFLNLNPPARRAGLVALAHCTPHPDIAWTKDNWVEPPIKNVVRAEMRWRHDEIVALLELIEPEQGTQRGSLGQCVYHLLAEDPDVSRKLLVILENGLSGSLGFFAALLFLWWSNDPSTEVGRLTGLGVRDNVPGFVELERSVRDHGGVFLD